MNEVKHMRSAQEENRTVGQVFQFRLRSWAQAVEIARGLYGWVFRGHRDETWPLSHRFERLAHVYGYPEIAWYEEEQRAIEDFTRRAPQFLRRLPERKLEWLSLMRHHGGATRLLDCTESFYVATHFAVDEADPRARVAIWAFNRRFLRPAASPHDNDARNVAEDALNNPRSAPSVLLVEPWQLHERIVAQQGQFLFPTSMDNTFEGNLCASLKLPQSYLDGPLPHLKLHKTRGAYRLDEDVAAVKFVLLPGEHQSIRRELKQMNITAASLFPGLEGLARSLAYTIQLFADNPRDEAGGNGKIDSSKGNVPQ